MPVKKSAAGMARSQMRRDVPVAWPLQGLAGSVNLSFHKEPLWVDPDLPAGHTVPPKPGTPSSFWNTVVWTWTPNLLWFAFALGTWLYAPFDLSVNPFLPSQLYSRGVLHFSYAFAFYSYFYITLYHLGWGTRKFSPASRPSVSRMIHNVWYWGLGILQYVVWEAAFIAILRAGALPYDSNADVAATPIVRAIQKAVPTLAGGGDIAGAPDLLDTSTWTVHANAPVYRLLVTVVLVPAWRELTFYFAHRVIHLKAIYRFVHSLHHRNTDPEPFSGMCMHPLEHMYYFSCIGFNLLCRMHPFAFHWNGVHLMLSPAASHSGWEDIVQSDVYHYLHHRFFECNYGTPGVPFDAMCGTYRETIPKIKNSAYRGAAEHVDPPEAVRARSTPTGATGKPGGAKGGPLAAVLEVANGVVTGSWLPATAADAVYWVFTGLLCGTLAGVAGVPLHHYLPTAITAHPLPTWFPAPPEVVAAAAANVVPVRDAVPTVATALAGARGACYHYSGGPSGCGLMVALLACLGPFLAGLVLLRTMVGDRAPAVWPFHRDPWYRWVVHILCWGLLVFGPTGWFWSVAAGGEPLLAPAWGLTLPRVAAA
eukprot:TRINITY_DN68195_c0_g1_i1.p1 TRINITY_DN68195_c0_g1~~TRINITY_DN68195_c0_g1_i1.p1  ORF type:complete len:593 (-),score=72.22 TRINITY_DN68195_c0_g1_i1:1497-3275(-)